MHDNSRVLYQLHVAPLVRPGMRVLEIGPDKVPSTLQELTHFSDVQWDLLDLYESPCVQIQATDETHFPVPDSKYDVVVAVNVLEHVRRPWLWIRELARVCRKDGYVATINPVSWPYHEAPIDCWRVFPEGMKVLYEDAGLDVVLNRCESHEPIVGHRDTPGRSISAYGWKHRLVDRLLGLAGYPQERCHDTVTIGVNRARVTAT